MKKIVSFVLLIAFALSLIGCGFFEEECAKRDKRCKTGYYSKEEGCVVCEQTCTNGNFCCECR